MGLGGWLKSHKESIAKFFLRMVGRRVEQKIERKADDKWGKRIIKEKDRRG